MKILVRKARSAFIRVKRALYSQRFGFDPAGIYEQSFYEDGGFSRTEHAAAAIADWASERLAPRSVLDLGAGAGYYLRAFAARGVEVLGVEASPAGVEATGDGVLAITYDLRRPLRLSRKFDIVMCVEVAEHLPGKFSGTIVESICGNCRRFVLFTAAPPGTPGVDHINCRTGEFWHRHFANQGFAVREDLTRHLRTMAAERRLPAWWSSWSWCLERERELETVEGRTA